MLVYAIAMGQIISACWVTEYKLAMKQKRTSHTTQLHSLLSGATDPCCSTRRSSLPQWLFHDLQQTCHEHVAKYERRSTINLYDSGLDYCTKFYFTQFTDFDDTKSK